MDHMTKAQPMRTLTISLSSQQIARLQSVIETGTYASSSEIIRDALRLWENREELRQLEVARLRLAYSEGIASGEGRAIDRDALIADLNAEQRASGD